MAEPVIYRILADMKTALEGITIANGYNQDVQAVLLEADVPTERDSETFINFMEVNETYDSATIATRGLTFKTARIALGFYLPYTETDDAMKLHRFKADIEKCLRVDVTRGGLAHWTRVAESLTNPITDEDRTVDGWVVIDVQFDHAADDPSVSPRKGEL